MISAGILLGLFVGLYAVFTSLEWNILQLDENFRVEKTNSSILKYFNYEKKEIIGKPIQFLFTESSRNIISNAISQIKQKEKYKLDLEVEAQKKNGQAFQAFLNISPKDILTLNSRCILDINTVPLSE